MKKNSLLKRKLINLLKNKEANIGIVGLGYVGLPLSLTYCENGYKVVGIDIDKEKINSINQGISYLHHIESERINKFIKSGQLSATNDFKKAKILDAIILCVPTPLNKYREPDLSYIRATMNSLKYFFREGQVLSLESTTYPGTTEEELRPIIEEQNLVIGDNFFLVYSPEREDPGNQKYQTKDIPKVMGGSTKSCIQVGKALYEQVICEVISVSSTNAAEMTKLLENIHRAVNIGLMNELKPLADKMGIDLFEVIRAAATKPFGFVPYYPGPGLGGHCIPIDPYYLTWKAREYGMHTRFIELSGEVNKGMPKYVIQKTADILNENFKPIKGSKILVLGVTYKKNIDDMRESPSLELIKLLIEKGAIVNYNDPLVIKLPKLRNYQLKMRSIKITKKVLQSYDAVLLATDHDSYDYELIKNFSKIIVDTRGRYEPKENIIRG